MEQLSDNRKKIREAFRSGQINAICGYPGIGKTCLTHQHPQFIDGFFSKQYYLDKKNGIVNPDFPDKSTLLRDLMPWGSTLGSVGGKRHPTETKDR